MPRCYLSKINAYYIRRKIKNLSTDLNKRLGIIKLKYDGVDQKRSKELEYDFYMLEGLVCYFDSIKDKPEPVAELTEYQIEYLRKRLPKAYIRLTEDH